MRAQPSCNNAGLELAELGPLLVKMLLIDDMRPRNSSGVLSWLIVDRRIELIVSPAPVSISMRNENQKTWEPAKKTVATP